MPTEPSKIVGSWFPTGYYGHYRNIPRQDFICEYRQLAKPKPPGKFVSRSLKPLTGHEFSVHDNRNCIQSSALYFAQGVGKRRFPGKAGAFNRDFYTWMPLKQEIERELPQTTTYQLDFTKGGVKQVLVERPITSWDGLSTTTYRYAYGNAGPNVVAINKLNETGMQLTTYCRQQKGRKIGPMCFDTVANCLNWYRPSNVMSTKANCCHVPLVPSPPQTNPTPAEKTEAAERTLAE